MSRDSVLALGRTAAEAGMVDTCVIRRVTGRATNRDTGAPVVTYLTPDVYTGKCRVQQLQVQSQQHDAGQDYLLLLRLDVQLPMSVTGLKVGDEITITASRHDADLVGRTFLVRDLAHKSEATARRVQCTERT
jgi:Family of unknown function (DUF6093)